MPQLSTVKNVLQSTAGKDRLLKAIFAGGKTIMVSFARVVYAFWLQASGLVYVVFTVLAGSYLVKLYRANHNHIANTRPFWQVGAFFVICFWFTLVSFRRASKTMKAKSR